MSLYDQSRADNQDILTRTDGLTLEMTVKNAVGTPNPSPVRGRVTEPGLYINPATGLPTVAKNTFVAFYTDDVSAISGADEKFEKWTIEFTSPGGEAKVLRLQEPMINRTLGYVQSSTIKK